MKLLLLALLVAACGRSSPARPDAGADAPVAPPDAPAMPATSTPEKLAADEAAGIIDHDTFLLYFLYAALAPELLPPQYALGDSEELPEGTLIANEARTRFPAMTAAMQAKFAPLFVRPTDPTSVASSRHRGDRAHAWYKIVDDDARIVAWYDDPAYQQFVQNEVATIDSRAVMTRFGHVMDLAECGDGQPRDPADSIGAAEPYLDIYFEATALPIAHRLGTTAVGATQRDDVRTDLPAGCQAPYIVIPELAGTAANTAATHFVIEHEVFHAFQLSQPLDVADNQWIVESTANWASDLFTHDGAWGAWYSVQSSTPFCFARRDIGPLVYQSQFQATNPFVDNDWYRVALVWSYFSDQGMDETAVGQIFQAAAVSDGMAGIVANTRYADWFSKFALAMWNAKPVDMADRITYDGHAFDTNSCHSALLQSPAMLHDSGTVDLDASHLPRTAAGYFQVDIDNDVKQVVVDLDALGGSRRVRGVETFANGDTMELDWGDRGSQTLCLDKPGQDVRQLFLAVADVYPYDAKHRSDPPPPGSKLHLEAKGACDTLPSTLTYTESSNVSLAPAAGVQTGTGSWSLSYALGADLHVSYKSSLSSATENDYLYDVSGLDTIMLDEHASLSFANMFTTDTYMASESATASGTCSTPSAPGDPIFTTSTPTGSLLVKVKPTGAATYQLDYDVQGIHMTYAYDMEHDQACGSPTGAIDTTHGMYDDAVQYERITEQNCDGSTTTTTNGMGNKTKVSWSHSTAMNPLFANTFDPDTGTIDIALTASPACTMPIPFTPRFFSDQFFSAYGKTCTTTESGKLHIELGPLVRP